jgi:hypothetical protein
MTAAAPPQAVGPFSGLAVLWMLVVGVVSALLFLVLTAYAPDLRDGSDGGSHALSKSAVGFAGLARLLSDEGVPTVVSRSPHPEREGRAKLLILTPSLMNDPQGLNAFRGPGVELIVLPKWATLPDPAHPGWVRQAGLAPAAMIDSRLLHAVDGADHVVRGVGRSRPAFTTTPAFVSAGSIIPSDEIDSLQTIAGPHEGWVSAVQNQDGQTVLIKKVNNNVYAGQRLAIRKSGREVYVLSDPDLLNNQGLAQLANAQGASLLINALRGGGLAYQGGHLPVVFDLTLAGFSRTRSVLGLAFEPPFLAATLCALAAAGLMGLHAAARFGAPLRATPAFAFGKKALADNSAALVRLVRREHRMGRGYAALTRALTAAAVGAPRDLDDDQLDALLDRRGRTEHASAAFTQLEREAREARDVAGLMLAARKLYHWRLEMTRERR